MADATLCFLGFVLDLAHVVCLLNTFDLGIVAEGGASVSFVNRSMSLPPILSLLNNSESIL